MVDSVYIKIMAVAFLQVGYWDDWKLIVEYHGQTSIQSSPWKEQHIPEKHGYVVIVSLFSPPSFFPLSIAPAPALYTTILKVPESESHIRTIHYQKNLGNESPRMSIEIPVELVREFATMNSDSVRGVSFLYYDVENLFPSGYQGRENRLGYLKKWTFNSFIALR